MHEPEIFPNLPADGIYVPQEKLEEGWFADPVGSYD